MLTFTTKPGGKLLMRKERSKKDKIPNKKNVTERNLFLPFISLTLLS